MNLVKRDDQRFRVCPNLSGYDFSFTSWANILAGNATTLSLYQVVGFQLQDMFLSLFVAWLTNAMHWFGALGVWLQCVGKRSRSESLELVALLLSRPCFKASNFCFKLTYSLNQRRLSRIGLYCANLGGHNLALEFDELGRALTLASEPGQSLNDARCGLERAKRAIDICKTLSNVHIGL